MKRAVLIASLGGLVWACGSGGSNGTGGPLADGGGGDGGGADSTASDGSSTDVGSPTDGGPQNDVVISVDAGDAVGFLHGYCALIGQCCADKEGLTFNVAACSSMPPSFTGTYDPQAGALCLDELRASGTYCVPRTGGAGIFFGCDTLFAKWAGFDGTIAPGGACGQSSDCKQSLLGEVICRTYSGAMMTPLCQVQVHGKSGDGPCIATDTAHFLEYIDEGTPAPHPATPFVCYAEDGVYCERASKTCKPIPAIGQACVSDTDFCGGGGFCDHTTSMCVAPLAMGASCAASDAICSDATACDPMSNTCVALLTAGAPCRSSEQCKTKHCSNNACQATMPVCGN